MLKYTSNLIILLINYNIMIQKVRDLKNKHLNHLKKEKDRVISELIKFGARKIIIFGSSVRGELGLGSDIDLIVIMDSKKDFIERTKEIYKNIQPSNMDLLIYTPIEFKNLIKNNLFIQHAIKQGKIIFERK